MCVCVCARVCCNPGSMDLERLRPLKHLWGATEQRYGSPSGTNSPWSCTLSPDQWNWSSLHTLFRRTAQRIFFFFPSSFPDRRAAHRWGCITPACLRDCVYRGRWGAGNVCVGVHLCVEHVCVWTEAAPSGQSLRLSLCTGWSAAMLMLMHSQWPQLRSQRCASPVATLLQLKAEGGLFGVGRTGLGYPGPCREQAHISRGIQTRITNCANIGALQKIPHLIWMICWLEIIYSPAVISGSLIICIEDLLTFIRHHATSLLSHRPSWLQTICTAYY